MAQTTVKAEQIAINAISGTIIADNAITSVHIAQNAILTQHIDDAQVDTAQLADDAVTNAKLADSSVVTAHIQDDQVTGDKLANNITIAGTLTSTGAFTSPGIDDNADAIAITIDSSEQVGIGNTSPIEILTLGTTSDTNTRISIQSADDGSGTIQFADGTSGTAAYAGYINYTHSDNALAFATGSAEKMRINSSGRLGIGTTSPDTMLHINGAANSEQVIITGNGNSGRGLSIQTAASGGQQDAGVIFDAQDTENGANPYHAFKTAGTERMRINSSGIITKPYTPAFSCNSSGTYTTTTGNQNLSTFASSNATSLNVGSHLSSGKFTAPVAGVYQFHLKAQASYSSGYLFIYVFKEGSAMSNAYHYMFQTNNSATLSFCVDAAAGDEFEPYCNTNYAGGSISAILFSGYLIG